MADISKIKTLDGTTYDIKDATARDLIADLPSGLQNLVDGSSTGSVRGIKTATENANYTIGVNAFAEGLATKASGANSHAEGNQTQTSGNGSHAEGTLTIASGGSSHAEGRDTTASGVNSHAEGFGTTASGHYSHAEGEYTIANYTSQHVFGKYNIADNAVTGKYIEIVGNGTADDARSNARTLDWSGNEVLAGTLTTGTAPEETGDTTHKVGIIVKSDIDPNTVPQENQWYRVFAVKDTNNEVRSYLAAADTKNYGQGVQIETKRTINNSAVYNGLRLTIQADGTRNVYVSDPAIWRTAINAVDKAGDTMTGRLNMYGATRDEAIIAFKLGENTPVPVIQARTQGNNNQYTGLFIQGAQTLVLASGEAMQSAYNSNFQDIATTNNEDLYLLSDNELIIYTGCNTIANAAEAIRFNTSGEISNNITMSKTSPILYIRDTARIEGTAPSGNQNSFMMFEDNNDNHVAFINSRYTAAKRSDIRLVAQGFGTGSGVTNELRLSVENDGTRSVGFSETAPWRAALGLGTSGDLPITIAQGGTSATTRLDAFKNLTASNVGGEADYLVTFTTSWTKAGYSTLQQIRNAMGLGNTTGAVPIANGGTGQTEVTSINTISSIATAGSGCTITAATYKQWGKVAQITITATKTAAETSVTSVTLGTLVSGKRPAVNTAAMANNANAVYSYISTNGACVVRGTFTANQSVSIYATYILP